MDEQKSSNSMLIPAAIIAAGLLIGVAVVYTKSPAGPNTQGDTAAVQKSVGTGGPAKPGDFVGDGQILGNSNAPLAIVEFADFQCPFCGRFFRDTEPQIVTAYVKTGKAKLVYRDFAFLGQESVWAAEAARCAADEGKFWQMHDYLFSHQQGENQGAFSKDNLKKFAGALGLNADQFNPCLDQEKYKDAIAASTKTGQDLGVQGTPATFVGGDLISGALPFDQFKTVIDAKLGAGK